MPQQLKLLFYDYVENIVERRAPHRPAHLELIAEWKADGRVVAGGATGDPPAGALIVFSETGHPGNYETPTQFFLGSAKTPAQRFNDTVVFVPSNARGTPISGVTFTWSSSNPSVATVSSTGLVTAVSVGTARIYATSSSNGSVTPSWGASARARSTF